MTKELFLQHVYLSKDELPPIPTVEELLVLRKGLQKKTAPDVNTLPDEYEDEGVGAFKKNSVRDQVEIHWRTFGSQAKSASFADLCRNPDRELDRLEFGWMIANFAARDGARYLSQLRPISYEDRHQNIYNKQYAREKKHFLDIVTAWRYWAVVLAGHMRMKT